ncbi:MAG: GntR family transcriptional regulator [Actinomycetota bacterium]|nr:GntR family transcriptional regulator [Actinomycetota bacterium]
MRYSRDGVARYNQLATTFLSRIESGEWRVSSKIPTVTELAAEYGVAPATIRQALGILDEAGLIARLPAKGTFVLRRPQTDRWFEVPTDWSGLLLAADGVDVEVLLTESGVQPPHVEHGGGTLAGEYRHWRRRHSRQGQRYYLGDAWVAEDLAQKIPESELTSKSTLRALNESAAFTPGPLYQTLTVRAADPEVHELLGIPLHSPIAHVSRTVLDEDNMVVFVSNGVYRGDVVRVDIKVPPG